MVRRLRLRRYAVDVITGRGNQARNHQPRHCSSANIHCISASIGRFCLANGLDSPPRSAARLRLLSKYYDGIYYVAFPAGDARRYATAAAEKPCDTVPIYSPLLLCAKPIRKLPTLQIQYNTMQYICSMLLQLER